MLPVYLDNVPSGSSTRPFVHYAQLYLTDSEFLHYDFGSESDNMDHYGTAKPPPHDLSKITAPIALFLGDKDDLADPIDGQLLADHLPNLIHYEIVDYKGFTHLDFVTAIDADKLIYETIVSMMKANDKNNFKK